MKYLKLYEDVNVNFDDWDEEEVDDNIDLKRTIIRVHTRSNYTKVLDKLKKLGIYFNGTTDGTHFYNDYPYGFTLCIDDYHNLTYCYINFFKDNSGYNEYNFISDRDILNMNESINVDYNDWEEIYEEEDDDEHRLEDVSPGDIVTIKYSYPDRTIVREYKAIEYYYTQGGERRGMKFNDVDGPPYRYGHDVFTYDYQDNYKFIISGRVNESINVDYDDWDDYEEDDFDVHKYVTKWNKGTATIIGDAIEILVYKEDIDEFLELIKRNGWRTTPIGGKRSFKDSPKYYFVLWDDNLFAVSKYLNTDTNIIVTYNSVNESIKNIDFDDFNLNESIKINYDDWDDEEEDDIQVGDMVRLKKTDKEKFTTLNKSNGKYVIFQLTLDINTINTLCDEPRRVRSIYTYNDMVFVGLRLCGYIYLADDWEIVKKAK